ncbi:hypothetical protein EDD18DRAFT_1107302 [Armillaria luteobubalina]|uniref:Uncharacterized protein n=1 Tax=Armillaria luteobubalina TaxID=153913 RepID=A0AA39Q115_9AGAR|nr:hypothetical protein EDD18DRAFT_1107302 [Armillaria luteobubalina]
MTMNLTLLAITINGSRFVHQEKNPLSVTGSKESLFASVAQQQFGISLHMSTTRAKKLPLMKGRQHYEEAGFVSSTAHALDLEAISSPQIQDGGGRQPCRRWEEAAILLCQDVSSFVDGEVVVGKEMEGMLKQAGTLMDIRQELSAGRASGCR